MQSYFIWRGIDSRSMGVILRRAAPLIRPEERVEHLTIPGLSGDLTVTEGQDIYNSYIQTLEISVRGGWRVRDVYRWLRGSGKVVFSSDPDKQQDARIIGAVTLNKVSRNLDNWAGSVQWYCQPLKERTYPVTRTLTTAGTLQVDGDVPTRPRITVTPSGSTVSLTVNSNTFTITGTTSGVAVVLDSYTRTALVGTTNVTKNTTGDFPTFEPGANTIGGSGWSSLVIDPRERFL